MLAHEFPTFQVTLNKRGKAWKWYVCAIDGKMVMRGSERSRLAARYNANRALFLLLLTSPYRSRQRSASRSSSPPLVGHRRPVG